MSDPQGPNFVPGPSMTTSTATGRGEVRTTSVTGGQKGVKLERHDLIPMGPLRELAEHFGKGAQKYDDHQWRKGYEWSKSYSAIQRHLTAFWGGEDYDVCSNDPQGCAFLDGDGNVVPFVKINSAEICDGEGNLIAIEYEGRRYKPGIGRPKSDNCYNHTGSHHMVAVAWHAFVLLEFKDQFPEFDDRYIPGGGASESGRRDGGLEGGIVLNVIEDNKRKFAEELRRTRETIAGRKYHGPAQ